MVLTLLRIRPRKLEERRDLKRIGMMIDQVEELVADTEAEHPSHVRGLEPRLGDTVTFEPWINHKDFGHDEELQGLGIENNTHSQAHLVRDKHGGVTSKLTGSPVKEERKPRVHGIESDEPKPYVRILGKLTGIPWVFSLVIDRESDAPIHILSWIS